MSTGRKGLSAVTLGGKCATVVGGDVSVIFIYDSGIFCLSETRRKLAILGFSVDSVVLEIDCSAERLLYLLLVLYTQML